MATYRYDPFGRTLASSGSLAMANTLRFSSKPVHHASGLYDYGYRWYFPNLQRWISRDPIEEEGGRNLYRFLRNAPVDYVDPFGLWPFGKKKEKNQEAMREVLTKIKSEVERGKDCYELFNEIKAAIRAGRLPNATPGGALGGLLGIANIPAGVVFALDKFPDQANCMRMVKCCMRDAPKGDCESNAAECAQHLALVIGQASGTTVAAWASNEWLERTFKATFCR